MRQPRPPRPLILVVDDEPGIVDFLRFALEDHGYRVHTAHDGAEALAGIHEERPDFVVTDLMMPRLDGWELCAAIRGAAETRGVPIIGMSAVDPRAAPFDVFLRKPFELDDLVEVLEQLATERSGVSPRMAGSSRYPAY